ncbi:MAG TPA: hypothetical protein VK179_15525 [Bacteroidales bacterium]|nr:hypothetical protein [Bacteroidales bacterium]
MEIQNRVNAELRNDIIQDLKNSALDAQYLKLISENDEVYHSFRELFMQLKGTTEQRVNLINEVIFYVRSQKR